MMKTTCPQLKQALYHSWSSAADLYTTNTRQGWRNRSVLLIICLTFSLILSSFLLLYLLYVLQYGLMVAAGIAGSCWVAVGASLFLSKRVRCFGVLFVLSCGMRQGRNVLITAGTSLVVLKHVQNTLENITGLSRSMVCNLQAKRVSIDTTPLCNYVRMLRWVGDVLRAFTDFGVAELVSDLEVTSRGDSEKLRERLVEAERTLNGTAKSIWAAVDTLSSVSQRLFPAFSFLLLMGFTVLHLRRYCHNKKYENVYITRMFINFDEKQKAEGRPPVLPLTPKEARRYITIPSPRLRATEGKAILKFSFPVFTHCLAWVLFIGVDVLMFWFVEVIRTRLHELEPFHVPLIMNINEDMTIIGVPISEEINRRDFSYQVSIFEKSCLPKPRLVLYDSILPLVVLLAALLSMSLMSAKLTQIRLVVCEQFFSTNAEERVEFLHAKILKKRSRKEGNRKAEESSLRSLIKKISGVQYSTDHRSMTMFSKQTRLSAATGRSERHTFFLKM
ncbi:dendritic cell-specific transmembrane protein isoform X1 [Oncorhynchus tshawytscha]|uniref:dendritic cell-specific transmembrane protein isoform X1 n=1 Tax=Oncorhynchus tshawytscha TaxID=74940 RepID=UPI000D0A5061|nr:dendritic cell-specific transmembrane protein isoform X1 [Oncorhynchus tshawytscha]